MSWKNQESWEPWLVGFCVKIGTQKWKKKLPFSFLLLFLSHHFVFTNSVILNFVFANMIQEQFQPVKYGAMTYWLRHWIPNSGVLCVQNHWVAPRSTQRFTLLRFIKWVPGISEDFVVKSKLPLEVALALRQLNPIHKKGP